MHYRWNKIYVRKLYEEAPDAKPLARAGVLPFCGMPRQFLFMTPRHKPGLTRPKDQIAKGGRLVRNAAGKWVDLDNRSASLDGLELEPLVDTAMREGREELGLLPDNVLQLYEIGPVTFISEKKRQEARMHLFAAHVASREDFEDVLAQKKPPVSRVRWLTPEEFRREGREDHVPIVKKAERLLQAWYEPGASPNP
jgi:8-oxo-dGTP pyrophosphatase MutT (NUDIX family)